MIEEINTFNSSQVRVAVTKRQGGFSVGSYSSFNLATHVQDDNAVVLKNRALLSKVAKLPSEPLWLQQTHSNIVINQSDHFDNIEADGIWGRETGVVLAVLTADCLPVLFFQPNPLAIAACHVGWRGLCNDIIAKTIASLPGDKSSIKGWVGPGIGACNFAVDSKVAETIMRTIGQKPSSPFVDLAYVAALQLKQLGVGSIEVDPRCVFNNSKDFFSHRKAKAKPSGRFASLIWLP